ncbi:MAG: NADH-quinone oxidoreductase subunit NuoK [Planctomyces sp.]|nr:NADH-quinone oxidoreductase subunit NuoK [Planctomyces sp.]
MSPNLDPNLAIAAVLFVLGAAGVLMRRNLIVIVLSTELMLHGVSLTLVTFSRMHGNNLGQVFTIFVLTVSACEAGLALALVLTLYQRTKSLDVNLWSAIREPDLPGPPPDDPMRIDPMDIRDMPRLTPAGKLPDLGGGDRTLLASGPDALRPGSRGQV